MNPLGAIAKARIRTQAHALTSIRRESRLKVAFVSTALVALWLGAFALARLGLGWLDRSGAEASRGSAVALAPLLVPRLFGAFAFVLLAMLTLSSLLLALGLLYRSAETTQLLTAPVGAGSICLVRLADVAFFSSWSSAYLGSPVLLAYGLQVGARWTFYPACVALFVPFVLIPAGLGMLAALLLVRTAAGLPRVVLAAAGAALVIAMLLVVRARPVASASGDDMDLAAIAELSAKAQSAFLPSAWLADGVFAAARADVGRIGRELAELSGVALLLAWSAAEAGRRCLHQGWSSLAGRDRRRRFSRPRGGSRLARLISPLPEPHRSLALKDIRGFSRDFSQWSQAALFFGVLALVLANLKTASIGYSQPAWQQWITVLDAVAGLLVLATFTTRFVFPLVSLEGRRFWILGIAPLPIATIVRQKFWLSVVFSAGVTVALTALSGARLRLAPAAFAITILTASAASLALSGLAVGLGSLYPNFTAESPARIVSGTGGTLTFIASAGYIVIVAAAEALLLRWQGLDGTSGRQGIEALVAFMAGAAIVAATGIAAVLPLRLGIANLERAEF